MSLSGPLFLACDSSPILVGEAFLFCLLVDIFFNEVFSILVHTQSCDFDLN